MEGVTQSVFSCMFEAGMLRRWEVHVRKDVSEWPDMG